LHMSHIHMSHIHRLFAYVSYTYVSYTSFFCYCEYSRTAARSRCRQAHTHAHVAGRHIQRKISSYWEQEFFRYWEYTITWQKFFHYCEYIKNSFAIEYNKNSFAIESTRARPHIRVAGANAKYQTPNNKLLNSRRKIKALNAKQQHAQ